MNNRLILTISSFTIMVLGCISYADLSATQKTSKNLEIIKIDSPTGIDERRNQFYTITQTIDPKAPPPAPTDPYVMRIEQVWEIHRRTQVQLHYESTVPYAKAYDLIDGYTLEIKVSRNDKGNEKTIFTISDKEYKYDDDYIIIRQSDSKNLTLALKMKWQDEDDLPQ